MAILNHSWFHVLGVHVQIRVLGDYTIVFARANQVGVHRFVGNWDKLLAHMRWPKVSWSVHLATKSFLKLTWVEHLHQLLGSAFSSKHDLELRFCVDEDCYALVEESLAPAHVSVDGAEEEVH